MTLSAILSILMESHEYASTTSLIRTLTTKTLNFAIRIDRVILQSSHLLPCHKSARAAQSKPVRKDNRRKVKGNGLGSILLVLVLDLLGSGISLLFSLLGTTLETEDELNSGVLRNRIIYQSVVISPADSGMGVISRGRK